MNEIEHWDNIYATRSARQVGWYTPRLETSLNWINDLELAAEASIIDVGGGASTLVDCLLASDFKNITLLDLAKSAISVTKQRLASKSTSVSWLQGDITQITLPHEAFELWHDRAVFHFLIETEQRQRYRDALQHALKPGGYFIVGAFSLDGPEQCSGLPVQRYNWEQLSNQFGDSFELKRHQYETHRTPSGIEQAYVYCLFQKTG